MNVPVRQLQSSVNVDLDRLPDQCPRCERFIQPIPLGGTFRPRARRSSPTAYVHDVEIAFCCQAEACQSLFLGLYYAVDPNPNLARFIDKVLPLPAVRPQQFPAEISALSPNFVKIHGQAAQAAAAGLDELVGPGLRRALEFLVKDFAISRPDAVAEDIRKMPLAQCVDGYIDHPSARSVVKRAVWLGNDWTHYDRKWTAQDLGDLKTLIRISVHFIEAILLGAAYEASMQLPDKKNPSD